MAFKKATKQVAYARIGGFGPMGSGKTTLMALLALYLSKTYHGGAPVAFLDTEKGSDFVEPYFAAEGVDYSWTKLEHSLISVMRTRKRSDREPVCWSLTP